MCLAVHEPDVGEDLLPPVDDQADVEGEHEVQRNVPESVVRVPGEVDEVLADFREVDEHVAIEQKHTVVTEEPKDEFADDRLPNGPPPAENYPQKCEILARRDVVVVRDGHRSAGGFCWILEGKKRFIE